MYYKKLLSSLNSYFIRGGKVFLLFHLLDSKVLSIAYLEKIFSQALNNNNILS